MNLEEIAPAVASLTTTDRRILKGLGMATGPGNVAAGECVRKGWVNRVGRWHVLTPAGLHAMTKPVTPRDQLACLQVLAGVPDRRCLGRLEELGMMACDAGFPVLTPLGVSTVEALRVAEDAKNKDFGRSVITDGERYRANTLHP